MSPNAADEAIATMKDDVKELFDWLWDRVADERDIVVDDLQEEEIPRLEEEDDKKGECLGSVEYKINMAALDTTIAELKVPGCTKTLVSEKHQKITDGIRTCWYGGTKDKLGFPHGEGMFKYENGDIFTGT